MHGPRMRKPWRVIWALVVLGLMPSIVFAAPQLVEFVPTQSVERGRATDIRNEFSFDDKQMYVWLHVRDAKSITLRWYRDDAYIVENTLKATGPEWRTWMRRRFRDGDVGHWRVEVSSNKRVLGEVAFTVGDVAARQPELPPRALPPPPTALSAPPRALPQPAKALPPRAFEPDSPAPPPVDLVETIRRRTAPDGCRALINFRVSPEGEPARYAVADVSFDSFAQLEHATGLIIQDKSGGLHALEVRRREHELRSWDELITAPVYTQGAPHRWLHLPGAQPLPAPARLREENRLTVLSTIGPYVGIDATMRSEIDDTRTDNSRYLTADASGALVDLRQLLGFGLEIMVARTGGGPDFDYRRMALVPERGLIAMFDASRIPLLSPPVALRQFSPDSKGVWRSGRCALRLAGHRIAASVDGKPLREVQARRLLPYVMLGVHWIAPGIRSPLDGMRDAQRRIARMP